MHRLLAVIALATLLQGCSQFIVITADPAGFSGDTIGFWHGKLLELMNPEELDSLVTLNRESVPLTRADIQRVLDWYATVNVLPCSDGSSFNAAFLKVRTINVFPRDGDLNITTYPRAPGPSKTYIFEEVEGEYVCTRVEDGIVTVTS